MREKNYEVALRRFNRALELVPGFPEGHNALGVLYQTLGEEQDAEKQFRAAVDNGKNFSAGHNNFGRFLCEHERVDEAIAQFDMAVSNPVYPHRSWQWISASFSNTGFLHRHQYRGPGTKRHRHWMLPLWRDLQIRHI